MLGILEAIENWVKELLISGIETNLARMFGDVNEKVGEIAAQVGQTPQGWNSSIFGIMQSLSETVILPIAEINLIDIYCKPNPPRRTATKTETITRIADAYNFMDDCMKEIAMTAAMKLSYLSDAEFDKTVFTPAQ